ncbi:MAG: plasmid segregation protein ParM [Clostridiales bacterium]|jgi:plasmid segregation protein ParM|nr:plasmid segregation protein ParM [Clostridiales bacterium]MDK2934011.1 plasmid segregation protein ParM [Clostridiales bacterium]
MEKYQIIGIDHGNASIKTHTGFECKSGFTVLNDEPIIQRGLLQYQSKYYSIGAERFPVKMDKTTGEDFFIITLAAIAESLRIILGDNSTAGKDIILSVGLPIVNYGRMKERFRSYFIRDNIRYKYEGKEYVINIKDCLVFPQSYSALLVRFSEYKDVPLVNVCNIGGGTTDCFKMEAGIINLSSCFSLPIGAIHLFNSIAQKALAYGYRLTENQTQQIIIGEQPVFDDEAIGEIVRESTQRFVDKILSQIGEHGLELKLNPTVFVGGGSILLKRFIEESKIGYTEIIEDPFANAKGFEMLARQKLLKR